MLHLIVGLPSSLASAQPNSEDPVEDGAARGAPPDQRAGRALVAGQCSFDGTGAPAGALLARGVVCEWLADAGIGFDVADASDGGVDWRRLDPRRYSELILVCGPSQVRPHLVRLLPAAVATGLVCLAPLLARIGADPLRRLPLELLVARFGHARIVAVNVSILGPAGARPPFDLLFERDSPMGPARPDVAFAACHRPVPVVGLLLAEHEAEHPSATQKETDDAIRLVLGSRDLAVVPLDTRLDRPERPPPRRGSLGPWAPRTPAQVESLIAKMDAVVTTHLHGAVLALKNGVPALVVDPVSGGSEVRGQLDAIGWPIVFDADALDPDALHEALTFVFSSEARKTAERCAAGAITRLHSLRGEFLADLALTRPGREAVRQPRSARRRRS